MSAIVVHCAKSSTGIIISFVQEISWLRREPVSSFKANLPRYLFVNAVVTRVQGTAGRREDELGKMFPLDGTCCLVPFGKVKKEVNWSRI